MSLSDGEVMREIESWRGFAEALRGEDRKLFEEMMRCCYEYAPAMQVKASPFPSEALFMGLLFMQQKSIVSLMKEVKRLKEAALERLDT
jgi:hypothetical protein